MADSKERQLEGGKSKSKKLLYTPVPIVGGERVTIGQGMCGPSWSLWIDFMGCKYDYAQELRHWISTWHAIFFSFVCYNSCAYIDLILCTTRNFYFIFCC